MRKMVLDVVEVDYQKVVLLWSLRRKHRHKDALRQCSHMRTTFRHSLSATSGVNYVCEKIILPPSVWLGVVVVCKNSSSTTRFDELVVIFYSGWMSKIRRNRMADSVEFSHSLASTLPLTTNMMRCMLCRSGVRLVRSVSLFFGSYLFLRNR